MGKKNRTVGSGGKKDKKDSAKEQGVSLGWGTTQTSALPSGAFIDQLITQVGDGEMGRLHTQNAQKTTFQKQPHRRAFESL